MASAQALEVARLLLAATPERSPSVLMRALLGSKSDAEAFDGHLLQRLQQLIPDGPIAVATTVEAAAAILEAHDRVNQDAPALSWRPVITAPTTLAGSEIVARTGATIIRQLLDTRHRARFYAPFTTRAGLEILADDVVRAASRGVTIEMSLPQSPDGEDSPSTIVPASMRDHVQLRWPRSQLAWPHLKLLTFDGTRAYVGSANLTRRGLTGENLELGVLVEGPQVRELDQLLDLLLT